MNPREVILAVAVVTFLVLGLAEASGLAVFKVTTTTVTTTETETVTTTIDGTVTTIIVVRTAVKTLTTTITEYANQTITTGVPTTVFVPYAAPATTCSDALATLISSLLSAVVVVVYLSIGRMKLSFEPAPLMLAISVVAILGAAISSLYACTVEAKIASISLVIAVSAFAAIARRLFG